MIEYSLENVTMLETFFVTDDGDLTPIDQAEGETEYPMYYSNNLGFQRFKQTKNLIDLNIGIFGSLVDSQERKF